MNVCVSVSGGRREAVDATVCVCSAHTTRVSLPRFHHWQCPAAAYPALNPKKFASRFKFIYAIRPLRMGEWTGVQGDAAATDDLWCVFLKVTLPPF
jgi:hypothetical protein